MKLTIAFCTLALAAGAQTFGVDSPALATLPAQPLADKCVSFGASTTLDTYEFNEQSNWSGATDVYEGWEKVTAEWESTTYYGGWYSNGPQSGMSCSAWWGNYWYNTNWHYCTGSTTNKGESNLAAGYCGFLYMGNDRVWVNFGTAVDKILAETDGAGAQHSVQDFTGIKEDGSNMDYTCAVTSVKTYNYPNHKCRVSMEYGEWDFSGMGPTVGGLSPGQSEIGNGNSNYGKESDDGTCVGAVDANGNTIARKCAMNDGYGTLTSDWFMSDSPFQVKLETISDHQGELYYHDTVKVECAVCETAAPTAYPTPEPTAYPTPSPTANPTAACRMTCELSHSTGLIEVTHDATSGHSEHRCYVNDSDDCVCECMGAHNPEKETKLQCSVGETIATWDDASEWQAGSFVAQHNYQICSAVSWTSSYGFTICSEAHKTYNANGDSSCNLDDTRSCSYTGWHHGSWGSCPSADGCHYYGWGWYRIVGNCIDGVDTMLHIRNYFGNGGDYCAWTSDTKEIPDNHAGVNGLNVQLKWKELNQKDANDAIIVYIKACQDAEMQDNCTPWTVAHDHFGDSPNGWDWLDHSDEESVDVQYKHNYFQTKIIVSTASNAPYMGAVQKAYAVDKLEVKIEKCE